MQTSRFQPKWRNTGLIIDRFEQIESYVTNRRVLDVGSVVGYKGNNWMHKLIGEKASYLLGIDIDKTAVEEIEKMGFNVIYADAQNFDLDDKFDVVHAGELIEHLDNFHGFLQSVKRHLVPGGMLIMTTPNGMRIGNFVYSILGGLKVNAEHTCWFCEKTISSLLKRNGFEVVRIDFLKHESRGFFRSLISKAIRSVLPRRVIWNTLFVVAKPLEGSRPS